MTTIGLLNPGEMGSMVGAAVRSGGSRVLWAGEGRSAATRKRASEAGLEDAGSVSALVSASDVILSVCPPAAAVDVAAQVAKLRFAGTYVDGNAVAPATAREIGGIIEKGGATFVDGGIIGPPPVKQGTTRFYVSGTGAERIAALLTAGPLQAIVVPGGPGASSARWRRSRRRSRPPGCPTPSTRAPPRSTGAWKSTRRGRRPRSPTCCARSRRVVRPDGALRAPRAFAASPA